jgi:hypothetical protein
MKTSDITQLFYYLRPSNRIASELEIYLFNIVPRIA